jgi:hypothetical protein
LTATQSVNGKNIALPNTLLNGYSTDPLTQIGTTGDNGACLYSIDLTGTGTGDYVASNPAVTASWNITPASISAITMDEIAKLIYGSNPIDAVLTMSSLVNGDKADALGYTLFGTRGNLSVATNASTTPYMFTVDGGLTDANYVLKTALLNPVGETGILKIGQAQFIVMALSGSSISGESPIYGIATGDFAYSLTGFVNGDTLGSINFFTGLSESPLQKEELLK